LGLYALLPLMVALMAIDVQVKVSETWHRILLVAIVIVVCDLALVWVDSHPRLVERSGAGLPYADEDAPAQYYTRRDYPSFENQYRSAPLRQEGTNEQE
jgi:hypothetical protein